MDYGVIAVTVGIGYGSACVIILSNLSYHKVCGRWVPQHLREDHRQTCLWLSEGFLQRHSWEGEDLLQQIDQVTKHESIITKPALNNRVGSGNTPHLLKQKIPSPWPLQVNWCSSCFGAVNVWYWNITLGKAASYSEILTSKLKPLSHNKCRVLLSKGVIFLYN